MSIFEVCLPKLRVFPKFFVSLMLYIIVLFCYLHILKLRKTPLKKEDAQSKCSSILIRVCIYLNLCVTWEQNSQKLPRNKRWFITPMMITTRASERTTKEAPCTTTALRRTKRMCAAWRGIWPKKSSTRRSSFFFFFNLAERRNHSLRSRVFEVSGRRWCLRLTLTPRRRQAWTKARLACRVGQRSEGAARATETGDEIRACTRDDAIHAQRDTYVRARVCAWTTRRTCVYVCVCMCDDERGGIATRLESRAPRVARDDWLTTCASSCRRRHCVAGVCVVAHSTLLRTNSRDGTLRYSPGN